EVDVRRTGLPAGLYAVTECPPAGSTSELGRPASSYPTIVVWLSASTVDTTRLSLSYPVDVALPNGSIVAVGRPSSSYLLSTWAKPPPGTRARCAQDGCWSRRRTWS